MKIQIASDLHLESLPGGCRLPAPEAFAPVRDRDVLVLAGDIGTDLMAREFIERELTISTVIYVPGNHEYYSARSRERIDADWHRLAESLPGLHYLVTAGVSVQSVRFWGAPWYSDLWGTRDPWNLATVHNGINDFWEPHNGGGEWTLSRHINHHLMQTDLLAAQAGKVDVVVTHWPPTRDAMHPRFEGDGLNPYFFNDREDLVRRVGARLWISGHTHEPFDYEIGPTRCVGNPAGYAGETGGRREAWPDLVVEI